jgi:hypothetical protein
MAVTGLVLDETPALASPLPATNWFPATVAE